MKIKRVSFAVALLACSSTFAAVLDFENFEFGDVISGPGVFSDLEFSSAGRSISVYDLVPGADLSGFRTARGAPFEGEVFRADFSLSGINFVSVALGDFGGDTDELFLNAYDSSGLLLDSDSFTLLNSAPWGGPTLAVFATDISYVTFGNTGVFPNSIFFDNFAYTTAPTNRVPDSGTSGWLAGMVLAGLFATKMFSKR